MCNDDSAGGGAGGGGGGGKGPFVGRIGSRLIVDPNTSSWKGPPSPSSLHHRLRLLFQLFVFVAVVVQSSPWVSASSSSAFRCASSARRS